jgi:hypothetical protein
MSNNQIPCIDCITLGICKSYIREINRGSIFSNDYLRVLNLSIRCSLLFEFLKSNEGPNYGKAIKSASTYLRCKLYEQ